MTGEDNIHESAPDTYFRNTLRPLGSFSKSTANLSYKPTDEGEDIEGKKNTGGI